MDKQGQTTDVLLIRHRNRKAMLRFLTKATGQNGIPTLINIDKSGENRAGIETFNKLQGKGEAGGIEIRQGNYLDNIIEQDHRSIKKRTQLPWCTNRAGLRRGTDY